MERAYSELLQQLKRHEGYRAMVYRCPAGKMTVGYGRNLEDRGVTKEEAEYLLMNDVLAIRRELVAYPWFTRCGPARADVLTNMAYNLGVVGLLGFKRMIAALMRQDYEAAADEMADSRWARQVGERATELIETMRDGRVP